MCHIHNTRTNSLLVPRSLIVFTLCFIALSPVKAQVPKTILHTFQEDIAGITPETCLIQGRDGFLYGTTHGRGFFTNSNNVQISHSGEGDDGTVFRINSNGKDFQILHSFHLDSGGCHPTCLVQGLDGSLYGITEGDDATDYGTVYKINTDGSDFKMLYRFRNHRLGATYLFQGSDGSLYGTTERDGGISHYGNVFKLSTNGNGFKVLHQFSRPANDGAWPSSLIHCRDGNLYGTTALGGVHYTGSVFKLNSNGRDFHLVYSFKGHSDGSYPEGGLIEGRDGNLYGLAAGDPQNYGIIYEIRTNGSGYRILHSFHKTDGAIPSGLLQGSDGFLYGTTISGGARNQGTVYKMSTEGTNFETLCDFVGNGTDGTNPVSTLVEGSDGNLYGVTENGGIGTNSYGCIFQLQTQIRSQVK